MRSIRRSQSRPYLQSIIFAFHLHFAPTLYHSESWLTQYPTWIFSIFQLYRNASLRTKKKKKHISNHFAIVNTKISNPTFHQSIYSSIPGFISFIKSCDTVIRCNTIHIESIHYKFAMELQRKKNSTFTIHLLAPHILSQISEKRIKNWKFRWIHGIFVEIKLKTRKDETKRDYYK